MPNTKKVSNPVERTKKVTVWQHCKSGESMLVELSPRYWSIPKKCHFHLAVGQEPCPECGSIVMVYFAVTSLHRSGTLENHSGMASCTRCGWAGWTSDIMKKVDETYAKVEQTEKQLEKLTQTLPRKNIGEV